MFDKVNGFGIVVNFPSKEDGTGDLIDHDYFVALYFVEETLEVFLVPHTRKGLLVLLRLGAFVWLFVLE